MTGYEGREQFIPVLKHVPPHLAYPNPVFSKCSAGHDLTDNSAYLYSGSGIRVCRECSMGAGRKPKRPAFDMFRKD